MGPLEGASASLMLAAAVAVVAALALALALAGARYRLALLMRPFLTLTGCDSAMDNRARYLVHGLIIDRPGISYAAVLRELGLPIGVVPYHLDILEREHYVRSVRDGRLKRFYTTDTTPPRDQRRVLEYAREALLAIVARRPGISQKELVRESGIDVEVVGYHLRAMVKDGALEETQVNRHPVYSVSGREGREDASRPGRDGPPGPGLG